ncbi:MAG TPA: glucuronate isomerase, partial [Gemmataceae bacterium]|nr:glucuronate isomerase [Gemmataceae bacterium]
MTRNPLADELFTEIAKIPLIDSHSHIDPRKPTSRSLEDILGYHYYTELAHSAGMSKESLAANRSSRERVQSVMTHMSRFDNTAQFGWFLEIAQTFLGYRKSRLDPADADSLFDTAERVMAAADWETRVLERSNIEKIFLTNDFDDPLQGFDTNRYVPCLRTDDLVFHFDKQEVRERLARATGVEPRDAKGMRDSLARLFDHFTKNGARACAISLPPDFTPGPRSEQEFADDMKASGRCREGVFWVLAELCQDYGLPFDLMIGVNRRIYEQGVFQGQDLFDQRTSLIQYAKLFNSFPDVTFCVSVLTSVQNQELVSYSWIFPNVVAHGHWWYSNIPVYISNDLRARLQAIPKIK